jgi:hypothetical protein
VEDFMWRRLAIAVVALALVGCDKPETRSLGERVYEHSVKRCLAMVPPDEKSRCDPPPGATHRDAANSLHRVMIDEVKKLFPARGQCSLHGYVYMICQEDSEALGRTKSKIYRLDDARDGSDSRVMYVWSEQW